MPRPSLDPPTQKRVQIQSPLAQVVKLVDALASGASPRKGVKVRVLSWAPDGRLKAVFDSLPFVHVGCNRFLKSFGILRSEKCFKAITGR